jgi:hypothetical protein
MVAESHSFCYIESDIPEDMTLDMWRRRHVATAKAARVSRLQRLRRRAAELAHPAPAPRLRAA